MKPTTLVNLNKEPYDVYIGRGSKWGCHGDVLLELLTHKKLKNFF